MDLLAKEIKEGARIQNYCKRYGYGAAIAELGKRINKRVI